MLNGDLTLSGNNTIKGNLEAPNGEVDIENSNNIEGDIVARTFKQGGNNVISGTHP